MKCILVAGGTGFVGRALLECLLNQKLLVVTFSRLENVEYILEKLISHGADRKKLIKYISSGNLRILPNVNLVHNAYSSICFWEKRFAEINLDKAKIDCIINLVTETQGSAKNIYNSNIVAIRNLIKLAIAIKKINPALLVIHMGSVSEKAFTKVLSPYGYAKRQVMKLLNENHLCDFHIIAGFIKGRGEKKVAKAAPKLIRKMRRFPNWFEGFKISIVDVEDVAYIISLVVQQFQSIIERIKEKFDISKPIEVSITNGEMTFGEMISCLVREEEKVFLKNMVQLPKWFENIYLTVYAILSSTFLFSRNQLIRRLGFFAKLALLRYDLNIQRKINHYLNVGTSNEIKEMVKNQDRKYITDIVPNNRNIISAYCAHNQRIYLLNHKNSSELREIVSRSAPE